jgi:uncharacterized protein (DUF305 family)
MKLFLSTIFLTICLSAGLGLYAQSADSTDAAKVEEKTGHKMETSPGAEKAPFDLQFIDTMTLHHRSAITMAELAAAKSQDARIKEISNKIITQQNAEIAEMAKIRADRYPNAAKAENMEMVGMLTSLEDMDMKKLKEEQGVGFDKLYIQMMSTHHQGGIAMVTAAAKQLSDNRLKMLGQKIITSQTSEVEQFKNIYKTLE